MGKMKCLRGSLCGLLWAFGGAGAFFFTGLVELDLVKRAMSVEGKEEVYHNMSVCAMGIEVAVKDARLREDAFGRVA